MTTVKHGAPRRVRPISRRLGEVNGAALRAMALGAVLGGLACAGCASSAASAPAPPNAPNTPNAPNASTAANSVQGVIDDEAPVRLDGLTARRLGPGGCGVFLWAQQRPVRLVFFSASGSGTAQLVLNGEEVSLALTDRSGREVIGQSTAQTFTGRDVAVDVTFTLGDELSNGMRLEEGRLRVRHTSGWSVVLPVGGLAACQP